MNTIINYPKVNNNFYEIFNELNHERVIGWLRTSLVNNLKLTGAEDSQKIKLKLS